MTGRRVALVVSDVDRALVTTDKVLPARNRAAVASLARHGIAFTIISSRPPFGMRMLIEPLDLRLPIAAFNGGVLAMPDLTVLARRRVGGDAVAALMGRCGVDPAEVVPIGDMDNDVPMFRRSGFSIAMGNGSAAAKETAQAVTGSNDEDGFAEAVERLILPGVAPA